MVTQTAGTPSIPFAFASTRRRRRGINLWIGLATLLALLTLAIFCSLIAPFSPDTIAAGPPLQPPDGRFWCGTDPLGRDLFSRIVYGSRAALILAVGGAAISASIGATCGLIAGYFGGWTDRVLSRLADVWLAFPGLLLALVFVARFGPSLTNTVLALGLVGIPSYYRLVRGASLSARRTLFVEAATAIGAGPGRIVVRHMLPGIASYLLVLATSRMGALVLAGGGLSFIGLGVQPPMPEWGALLASGRDFMATAPWLAIYPGIAILLTVAGLNVLGDGLRDMLDPFQS